MFASLGWLVVVLVFLTGGNDTPAPKATPVALPLPPQTQTAQQLVQPIQKPLAPTYTQSSYYVESAYYNQASYYAQSSYYSQSSYSPEPSAYCCKICSKGKVCGNSCISRSYTCHKAPGCACDG